MADSKYPYKYEQDPIQRTAKWTLTNNQQFTSDDMRLLRSDLADACELGYLKSFVVDPTYVDITFISVEGWGWVAELIIEILKKRM